MAVQITKEFITNVSLFVIAIVALGLSIGAIMNNPCKDKFGDINCDGSYGSSKAEGDDCYDFGLVCGDTSHYLCKKGYTCNFPTGKKIGKCVLGPDIDCRTMNDSICRSPGGSGGGSSGGPTGPIGPTHTNFDPSFDNGGNGKSKQSSSEEESQDESGNEPNPHDLTWLWITLGSIGGVALLATLFLMMKKK